MLESGLDQGAGLRRLMPPPVLRFMPVIQHSRGEFSLQLLWQLCEAYVDGGETVAVLDTSAAETEQEPGLLQMLESTMPERELLVENACAIVPARLGWQRLLAAQRFDAAAAETLSQYFGAYSILIVYGSAERIGPAFAHSGVRPLVPVAPSAEDMLSSYQAIKHLLQDCLLLPTAAVMITERTARAVHTAVRLKEQLQRCVNQHIGCELDSVTIQSYASDDQVHADMQRLSLRLLEHALSLGNPMSILPLEQRDNTGMFPRSH